METIRQSAGIDCSKDDFAVTFSICKPDLEIVHLSSKSFNNDIKGFEAFLNWTSKLRLDSVPLICVMESTGVYHEKLACFLYDAQMQVAVVLPQRAKNFSKTLKVKTITDKESSKYLAVMGLEKKLDLWSKPERFYIELRQYTREREKIQEQITQIKNQLHAETSGGWLNEKTVERSQKNIQFLKEQKQEIEKDIKELVKKNKPFADRVKKITTVPGLGDLTVLTVLAETHGFSQIRNKRQLVSYAGYDVVEKQSGTSVYSKPRISKKGNRHIRKAMHMPALASIRSAETNKELFKRIVSKSGIKMKGVVAVQRKLLVLIYILWKNEMEYDPNYELTHNKQGRHIAALDELDQVRS